ncbi:MAG: efflux transporter outer membrane subunit, partial [Bacteroidales bacterium]
SLNLAGGWSKTRSSRTLADGTSPYSSVIQDYAYATVTASWEIDIFGSVRKQAESAKYSYFSDIDTYNAVIMSLVADMATYYALLRTYQQQLIVANKNIASQKAILDITEVRYNTGLASQLDVAQAKSVYFSTQSSIPVLVNSIRQQINAITVLAGMFPPQLYTWLSEPNILPEYIQIVPVGMPENILSKRPDISAALQKVKAAEATVGGAKTGFLPKFYLNGSFGFASKDMNRLFNNNSITYQIAPQFNWTLFQGTALINAAKQSKSQYDATIRNYNNTLLQAMQEVDNAMSAYSNQIKQVVDLRELVVQGEVTLKLSLDLYKRGLANFQNVLDAQRSLLAYQNSLVSAQGNTLTSLISLYRAIGGGWQSYEYQK